MHTVSSRRHPVVQALRAARHGEGDLALIDGWHLLQDAVAARLPISAVAVGPRSANPAGQAVLASLADATTVIHVSADVLDAISPVRQPTGVVALAMPRRADLASLLRQTPALVLVAVDLQDPGNVGGVIRGAEAGGASGVLLVGDSADPWQWKALRAAMGSTFRLPVARHADAGAACTTLAAAGLRLLATSPHDGVPMSDSDLTAPCAILIGGEGAGLPGTLLERCDARITIPMAAPVESLNAAVAAAILVYEARRQRTSQSREGRA